MSNAELEAYSKTPTTNILSEVQTLHYHLGAGKDWLPTLYPALQLEMKFRSADLHSNVCLTRMLYHHFLEENGAQTGQNTVSHRQSERRHHHAGLSSQRRETKQKRPGNRGQRSSCKATCLSSLPDCSCLGSGNPSRTSSLANSFLRQAAVPRPVSQPRNHPTHSCLDHAPHAGSMVSLWAPLPRSICPGIRLRVSWKRETSPGSQGLTHQVLVGNGGSS